MAPHPINSSGIVYVTVLIKLGVIASLASIIGRFGRFRQLLMIEDRTIRQKLLFAAFLGIPFTLGVLTRLIAHYQGADLSLEITVVAGLVAGMVPGLVTGMMVSLPAVILGHEFLALPMAALYALVAGTARFLCPNKEEVWKFSPFIDLSLYRSIKQRFKHPAMDWQVMFFLVCASLEMARIEVGRVSRGNLFYLNPPHWWSSLLLLMATAIAVALPLRVWNGIRMERKLEEKERMLIQARVDALISQINPHFLFNTLSAVSSLIRIDPDLARSVLHKLSNILRLRLKTQTHFVTLRQELDFIADYLDIEIVRFGRDKLQVQKAIEPEALDAMVPSMILQPLVENAIRHGISPKIEGGTVTLRAVRRQGRVTIEISDDGVGIAPEKLREIYKSGIGITNVRERLKVLYGEDFAMKIESQPGRGTTVHCEFPELVVAESPAAVPAGAG